MTSSHEEHTNDQQLRHEDDMTTDERDRIAVVQWLKDNYTISTGGSVSKCEVYAHYLSMCRQKGVTFPMSRTFYGKLVRRAFPGIKSNRKGPRGQAKQHYTHLVRRTEDYVTGGEMTPGATGSPAGQRRSRSTSLPSSPALSPSSMNSSGCLSFTFQVRPQKPRQRSSSCKSSFTSSSSTTTSASSSVQCSPVLSPLLYTSMPSSTTASPASSACSSPRQFLCSPVPSSPVPSPSTFLMPSPSPSTPQQSHYPSSQPSSPWPQNYDQSINREEGHTANTATSLSPYLDAWPMLEAPSILSTEAEALLYRCAMLKRVRERCRETQNGVERPTRDSFLFRAINDPSWNDAWADLGFAEWCLDNLL